MRRPVVKLPVAVIMLRINTKTNHNPSHNPNLNPNYDIMDKNMMWCTFQADPAVNSNDGITKF